MTGIDIKEEWEKHKASSVEQKEEMVVLSSLDKLKEEIYSLLDTDPLLLDEEIQRIAKAYGKKPKRIEEQLEIFRKERKDKLKQEYEQGGEPLSADEYAFIKAKCDNQRVINLLTYGLEDINLNTHIRSEIRMWLRKYQKDHAQDNSLRWQFISLVKDKKWAEATEMLVEWVESKTHIYTTKVDTKREVFIYKDGIYVPEGRSEIEKLLRELLLNHYSQFVLNKVLEKIEPDTFIESEELFNINYPDEVPVLNGILNIRTLELNPYDPKKIFFNKINASYDLNASCPTIDFFLREVLSKPEDIDVFYEMVGFCLLKDYTYEKAFMLVGNGRNGKGKSIELIKYLLGPKNCSAIPLSLIIPDSFEISELRNKLVNLAGDISNTDLKDTSMFKSVTGRDLINGKRKFLHSISFVNFAKMVFACNELPMVYDNSRGFWDRWILLDYPYTFVDKPEYDSLTDKTGFKIRDPDIISKLTTPEELSGLLNMALIGLHRLFKNNTFSTTQGSSAIKETWVRRSNSFMAFCLEFLVEDLEGHIQKKDLRKRYSEYCKKHKLSPKSDIVIKRTLQDTYGAMEERKNLFSESYDWVWSGVKFK